MLLRRGIIALLLSTCAFGAQGQLDEDQVWSDFLAWFRTQPLTPPDPALVSRQYGASLESGGKDHVEIARRVETVQRLAAKRPDAVGLFFDKIYAGDKPIYNIEPNAFLADAVRDRKPGAALDCAMGQGRNALYLAQKGWQVTGFDVAAEGLAIARANAAKAGVKIETVLAGYDRFDFGKDRWDLIALIYAVPPIEDPAFLKRLRDALKPGGIIVLEHFLATPGAEGAKGEANALLKTFESLRILHYEDTEAASDWKPGKSRVGRIVAGKM